MRDSVSENGISELQKSLNRLADSLAETLRCDLALISFQHNDSIVLLGLSSSAGCITARRHRATDLVCLHVIENNCPLVLSDARRDPSVAGLPVVREGPVVAYLGVPIRNAEIGAVGAVCGISSTPREWQDGERRYLEAVAFGVENMILREMYRLESQISNRLLNEYDEIISAFSQVRAEPTSIHDRDGRLVFANRRLIEQVPDAELHSAALRAALRAGRGEPVLEFVSGCGQTYRIERCVTASGQQVCHWACVTPRLN